MNHNMTYNKIWQWLVIITLLGLFILPAQAAIPDNVDYQGYLTDSSGSPINGTVSVTFSLYNIDTGGITLWTDTQPVNVTNGLFNIKLGRTGNPFPLGLFDAPLWLGIDVASDGEMTPRTALSSAGFAHKADDADSVGGISPGSLLQSGDLATHTSNASAHHIKTKSFTELLDQAADVQIPGNITRDVELAKHGDTKDAHHSRFTSAEAIGAMGTKLDTNPLHHNKRSNTQVFAAVTGLDGAGSLLDADLVDGMQANEIIDAAQDEVRTPISSLPFTISTSGSYYVTGNLDGSSGGIDITSNNVTLDLMGFTLDGGGTVADHGINFSSRSNITIKNGTVRRFGLAGIYQNNIIARYATIIDVKALDNGALATATQRSGIYLYSSNSHIERCTAGDNGGNGIFANHSSKLINNAVYGNTGTYGIYGGYGSVLSGNTAYNNSGTSAIAGKGSSILRGNIAYGNTLSDSAISGGTGATISDNTAFNNSGTGISGDTGANISNNTAYNNSRWGIRGTVANTIQNNTVYSNNTSNTANEGGLFVSYGNQVKGNTLTGNSQSNIVVGSSGNMIEENLLIASGNGILFSASGNFYAVNRASVNTTDYNLGATTQTNGGGNFSF